MSDTVVETTENNAQDANNPYAYLDRGDFSSEKFKIEIKNLPKFYGIHEFRKLLNEKLKLGSSKIKTPFRNSPYAFVCFRSDEERENAIKVISGFTWKGKSLNAIKAKAAPDPLVKKRKDNADNESESKKVKVDNRTQEEKIKSSTVPLWDVPYEEQLQKKQANIKKILEKLANNLAYNNPDLKQWLEKQKSLYDGLPCELESIRHSDKIEGYRNKCEFTVGIDEENGLPTVGFRIGSYVNGITGVAPVDSLVHIPEIMKRSVKIFQEFVRKSDLKPFNPELQTGNFRQLTARTAGNQLMLIVGIHPQNLSKEDLEKFKCDLKEFFLEGVGKEACVTSLYYQEIRKKASKDDQIHPEHLLGETHIVENILGLKFRISPEAFFQINTLGAEVLYKSAIELANPTESSTVIDVCCGTGTIGLCFAKSCAKVFGVEIIPQAVEDAKENAKLNEIENSEFFAGKAEDILTSVVYRAQTDDVIAIVDPPRAGLHQKAVAQLRKITKVKKLIYVSCNPNAAFKNFIDFGRPTSKTMQGEPFLPVKAVAVDMFPYTEHCELVLYFERADELIIQS